MSSRMNDLRSLLPSSELFEQGQPEYHEQSEPWSKHAELHPKLVVQPATLDGMRKAVGFLYDSDLDFAVRNTGTGSVSARDVILNTHGFKSFSFDKAAEAVTIGAGLCWGEVDQLMEERAPSFVVMGARCPWVGVAGSSLVGGLSWLSHEFGLISDPQNLLDAQVVLRDGRVVWAAQEEPDLMWALRGGGGNYGVVTALKLRARPYVEKIFGGVLAIPYSSLYETAKGLAAMSMRTTDPKVAMHVVNLGPGMGLPDQGPRPGIGIIIFDARGEENACPKDGFAWVFGLPGSTVLLEFMQKPAFNFSTSRKATGWLHSGHRHVLQVVIGCRPENAPFNVKDIAMKRLQAAGPEVAGSRETGEFHAGFLHEWHSLRQVNGENYDRLRELKKRYDPRNRFNKGVDLVSGKVSEGMSV